MTQASQLIAKQYTEAGLNKKNWGAVAYNVLVEGLTGDGVTDDTAALQALINTAIAADRRTILFPHGTYYVTALTNDDQVDFVGDNSTFTGGYTGTITDLGALAALMAEQATLNLNLAHYADFASLADDYDITTIIQSAMTDLATTIAGTTGWRLLKVSIFIPGGHWKVTTKKVFDPGAYSITGVRGFNIYGAGCENTQITFDSNVADTDNYLIYNNDKFGFSEIRDIRFVAANGVEKCIYNATAGSGNAQSIIYSKVAFVGFQTAIAYEGLTMTSEMDYYSCKFTSIPSGGYGIYMDNVQSVNHNLYACDFETFAGHGIHIAKGGNININGGSIIPSDGGVFLVTTDGTGAGIGPGNNVFNIYGIRTEVNGTGKLFEVDSNVVLNFDGCNLTKEISGVGNVRGTFGDAQSFVTFTKCTNNYKYECAFSNSVYSDGACTIHFENCMLGSELADLVSITGSGANVAGKPLISSKNCRKNSTGTTQRTIMDITLNKEVSNLARAINTHTVLLRTGNDSASGLPSNAGATFILPLNAIIKKIRIVKLATSAYPGTYAYDVKDYLGTTIFASLADTGHNTEASAVSADLWYRINTVAKQSISVTQTGTNSPQTGYIVVEYI